MTVQQSPTEQPQQQVVYQQGEPYRPERKYLSASNTFYLALKVWGYAFLGGLVFYIAIIVIVLLLGGIANGLS